MKKVILFFIVSLASVMAFSQDFKPFRVGIGLGYASPAGSGAKGGVLFYVEPSYRVSDAFAVGLRAEVAVMARGTSTNNGSASSFDGTVSGNGSYTLNGQYYFSNGGFRPFIGAGFGIYRLASETVDSFNNGNQQGSSTGDVVSGGTKFGFYPRIGFDAGHFVFNVEYNILGNSVNTYDININGVTSSATSTTKNNYLGVKIGWFISGGRK